MAAHSMRLAAPGPGAPGAVTAGRLGGTDTRERRHVSGSPATRGWCRGGTSLAGHSLLPRIASWQTGQWHRDSLLPPVQRTSARRASARFRCHEAPDGRVKLAQWKLSGSQLAQIDSYVVELQAWNQKMNLTAISGRDAIMERHVADSLALLPILDELSDRRHSDAIEVDAELDARPVRLIDVGTGAGLPGLVLAIARPGWQVCLLDSLNKRCDFLRHVIATARIKNASVVCARAEDAGKDPGLREKHDLVVARAVAEMRVLAELCLPLASVGGAFVAAKGPNPEVEVAAAESAVALVGGRLERTVSVNPINPEKSLTAVVYKKVVETNAKYPRRAGMPSKRPL